MAGKGVVEVVDGDVADLVGAMTSLGVVMGEESFGAGAMTTGLGGTVVTVELADPDQFDEATVALTDGNVR